MARRVQIALTNLLIDANNPRFENSPDDQRDAICAVARNQGTKLLKLADDIAKHGLNPADSVIVMKHDDHSSQYVVLEGNRRVAAMKLLSEPDLLAGSAAEGLLSRFKGLREAFRDNLGAPQCVVFDSREEAAHWIELRHTGENGGAGIVRWGGKETARFRQRGGHREPYLQLLDLLRERGFVSSEKLEDVPVTSLKRLLSTPYVRTRLGVEILQGRVTISGDEQGAPEKLLRVIDDLASRRVRVRDLYHASDRRRYVDELLVGDSADVDRAASPSPTAQDASASEPTDRQESSASEPTQRQESSGRKSVPSSKRRKTLVPKGFALHIEQSRINNVFLELQQLDIEKFTNAVSVLLRVFIELSLDDFIKRKALSAPPRCYLKTKLETVIEHMKSEGTLDSQELKPVRRALQKDCFLASTLSTMNDYVHNQHFCPTPSDLRAAWDSWQLFIAAIWE